METKARAASAASKQVSVTGQRPDPEVPEKAARRTFPAEYKLQVLREADACKEPGQIGALLRREGLYSSHLTAWRHQREAGALQGLHPRRRGKKPHRRDPVEGENQRLRRQVAELERKLEQARTIIDVQKKVSQLLQRDSIQDEER